MSLKIQINTAKIRSFMPYKHRLDNWLKHYSEFDGDISEFLNLDKITTADKIWACVRVLPREQLEYFAIDAAFAAEEYINCLPSSYHVWSADGAANCATDAVSLDKSNAAAAQSAAGIAADFGMYMKGNYGEAGIAFERERQVECLKYLIKTAKGAA